MVEGVRGVEDGGGRERRGRWWREKELRKKVEEVREGEKDGWGKERNGKWWKEREEAQDQEVGS